MTEIVLTVRHPRGSRHQRRAVGHRGSAGQPELLRPLPLPLQTSGPAVDLGERSPAEQHRAWGGPHTPPGAPQADVTGPSVLHRVSPGETQAQMSGQLPGSKGSGRFQRSACDV